jgi:hypothetical protein
MKQTLEKEELYTLSTHVNKETFDNFYDICYLRERMSKSAMLKKLIEDFIKKNPWKGVKKSERERNK